MSNRMVNDWKKLELPTTQKFVGWVLSDCLNDQTGQCDPSILSICKLTGLSDRAVSMAIKALQAAGHITVHRPFGKRSNYRIHPRTSFAPEADSPPNYVLVTPEGGSPQPPKEVRDTPERRADKTEGKQNTKPNTNFSGGVESDFSDYGTPKLIDRIVSAYPVNGNGMEARRALATLNLTVAELQAIQEKTALLASCISALPDYERRYCPAKHTFFQERRWEDDPTGTPWVVLKQSPNKQSVSTTDREPGFEF